jgi:glycosyltransferase involved in cell wall biosynthesis
MPGNTPSNFPPGISIVICCYNSAAKLPHTLEHLAVQHVPEGLPWELILINNASTDDTPEVALQQWAQLGNPAPLRIIEEPRPGTDHARRTGVFSARFSIILFCDDDNWLAPDYLLTGWQFLESHLEVGLVGGQSEAVADVPLPDWFHSMSPYYAACAPAPHSKDFSWEGLWSAGLFGRTSQLRKVFDPDFPFLHQGRVGQNTGCGEDAEMCMRSFLLGWRTKYLDALSFRHAISRARLTREYAEKLMISVQHASGYKAVYQRAIQVRNIPAGKIRLFYLRQYLKLAWPMSRLIASDKRQMSKDLAFFLRGDSHLGRRETIAVKKFMDHYLSTTES